jgi:hypothetical protein
MLTSDMLIFKISNHELRESVIMHHRELKQNVVFR